MSGNASVRIMTWNIHGAVGRNPRFDLMRVVEVIKRADPDIVALQEVDSRRRSNGNEVFALLHQLLGAHGIGAKSITGVDGDYGQLLISRCPIVESRVHDISYPEREPRRAIKAEIDTPAGPPPRPAPPLRVGPPRPPRQAPEPPRPPRPPAH